MLYDPLIGDFVGLSEDDGSQSSQGPILWSTSMSEMWCNDPGSGVRGSLM